GDGLPCACRTRLVLVQDRLRCYPARLGNTQVPCHTEIGPMAGHGGAWPHRFHHNGSSGTYLPVKEKTMASVTFDAATRLYPGGTRPAVDKLNLEVGDGEFLVLVGPSGCGKSTSLRMLAGLEEVNEGRILIGDRDVTDVPPKDR